MLSLNSRIGSVTYVWKCKQINPLKYWKPSWWLPISCMILTVHEVRKTHPIYVCKYVCIIMKWMIGTTWQLYYTILILCLISTSLRGSFEIVICKLQTAILTILYIYNDSVPHIRKYNKHMKSGVSLIYVMYCII